MYQNAMWIAESEPELAWLMFVSAVEVAANYWRKMDEAAIDRLKISRPNLVKILEPHGEELLREVAEEVAPYMGSTKKFIDFLLKFLPDPPASRPAASVKHDWTVKAFKDSFSRIYGYRSDALHGGTPFPLPMCERPARQGIAWTEMPMSLAKTGKGGQWERKDTPMLLHLFEYIVRNALLKWWQSMVVVSDTDTQATAKKEKVEVTTVDTPATRTAS
jgi:hypothetical protein